MDDFLGSVVLSESGHDKGCFFIVTSVLDDNYVMYADGNIRTVDAPKKKKVKHLKKLGKSSILDISAVTNKQLREAIRNFTSLTTGEESKEE